eukprot:jgi/Botrbrau1/14535/Bobra.0212s0002.1
MSTKEEKPTLAGVQIKARKRNVAVALDPGSFADAVVSVFEDAAEGESVEKDLHAAVKVLEGVDLDFSRYGDSLFEILFTGGRMAAGGNVVDEGKKLKTNVLASEAAKEPIMLYITIFQTLLRRRPFLVRPLENTLIKLLKSLDFYQDEGRKKIAIATARCFAVKIGVQPDRVLLALLNDRMVAKGVILQFVTEFFKDFLGSEGIDDLVSLLGKAKLESRLLEFFPPHKRTADEFESHFKAAGLDPLVEYSKKKAAEVHLEELKTSLVDVITSDPPLPVSEVVAMVKAKKAECQLPDTDVIKVIWTVVVDAVGTQTKNAIQITTAVGKQVKLYNALFQEFCKTQRTEAALVVHVQVYCYEDAKLLKLFAKIVRILYDNDILGEDTIHWWYKKGSHPKGRNVFVRDIEPFIKWLEEAEEDDEDEEA